MSRVRMTAPTLLPTRQRRTYERDVAFFAAIFDLLFLYFGWYSDPRVPPTCHSGPCLEVSLISSLGSIQNILFGLLAATVICAHPLSHPLPPFFYVHYPLIMRHAHPILCFNTFQKKKAPGRVVHGLPHCLYILFLTMATRMHCDD
jgi:hypothetical protein